MSASAAKAALAASGMAQAVRFPTTFRFGEWRVNSLTNSVENGTDTRQMEPRAMDVLVALCQRDGTIVSAEELLAQCCAARYMATIRYTKSLRSCGACSAITQRRLLI